MKKQPKKERPSPVKSASLIGADQSDLKWQLLIAAVAVISFGFSVFNDYALDDFIVLVKNAFVQKGFSGIWSILSKDTFAGMSGVNVMVLAGGRYRPLSVVTFAIEHQLWGNIPFIAHFINVLLYALIGILLYRLMKKLLAAQSPNKEWINIKSALIALLFISLPVHSEPVINVKGRDDLMCLIFFLLAITQLLKYIKSKTPKHFYYSSLFYFLSLMSKETALTFILVFPLILYFFTNAGNSVKIKTTAIYFSIALLFLFFRYLATKDNHGEISNDVLNNPFVHASFQQKYATIFVTWIFYLKLLVAPINLSYDYNYNQFPLTNFYDWKVVLSVIIHIALISFAVIYYKKRSIYSFSILFYFIIFSILSNFFFNIGSIFADRFLFIPSIGFCIAVVSLGFELYKRLSQGGKEKFYRLAGTGIFATILLLSCVRNFYRCEDWKDNNTLFISDTRFAPQSAKVQLNAGLAYISMGEVSEGAIRDSLLRKSMIHLQKGIDIYPTYIDGYQNMGVVNNWLHDYDAAEKWWKKVKEVNPVYSQIPTNDKVISNQFYQLGIEQGSKKNFNEAVKFLLKAYQYDTLNSDLLYNLGGAYFTIQKIDSAKYFFQKTLQLNPSYTKAADGLRAIEMMK